MSDEGRWVGLARGELKGAAAKHSSGGNTGHDRLGLHVVEVAEELLRAPPPHQTHAVAMDACAQHGHSATGACGPGRNIGGGVRRIWVDNEGDTQAAGYIGGHKVPKGRSGSRAIRVDRGRQWNAIFLTGERQSGERSGLEVGDGACDVIQGGPCAGPEREVAKAEEIIDDFVGSTKVFTRPEQKIKRKDKTLGRHPGSRCLLVMDEIHRLCQESERQGLHAGRWVIGLGPRLIQRGNPKVNGTTVGVQARVRGPHACKRLAHGTNRVFHISRPHWSTAGSSGSTPQTLREALQDGDGVLDGQRMRVDGQGGTEVEPEGPHCGSGVDPLSGHPAGCRCLYSAPVSAKLVECGSWYSCQGDACGYDVLKRVRRAVSDKFRSRLASSAMTLARPAT